MNSCLETALEGLGMIWASGSEAVKLQQSWGARSIADTLVVLKREGYEVSYVDLPDQVSGFAKVISGTRYIVLNRAKSAAHLQFTLSHELGHHILHLRADQYPQSKPTSNGLAEFQAHQFATLWILFLANDKEREDVLNQNPEWFIIGVVSLFLSVGAILFPLLVHLLSCLRASRTDIKK